jgi:hypothetical protein
VKLRRLKQEVAEETQHLLQGHYKCVECEMWYLDICPCPRASIKRAFATFMKAQITIEVP